MSGSLSSDCYRFHISDWNGAVSADRVADKTAHLMISIRNRAFNRHLIDAFLHFALETCAGGIVTVVDQPYLHNIAAETQPGTERDRRSAALQQMARERTRNAARLIRRHDTPRLRLLPWTDLASATPDWIAQETTAAFHRDGAFAQAVMRHVKKAVSGFSGSEFDMSFCDFFLEELPVLIYAGYILHGGTLDCYPAPQVPLLWDLDRGGFADELPRIAELIRGSDPMLYAQVELVTPGLTHAP